MMQPAPLPSRESYGPAADRLAGLARAASPDELVAVSDELLSISRLLGREPRLRRTLADPAAWPLFVRTLARHGRARIEAVSTLTCDGVVAGRLSGRFVALLTEAT